MRNKLKIIGTVVLTVILMLIPTKISAEEKLTVNNYEVSNGDVITYEFYMSGVEDSVEAAGAFITFNPDYLEYIDGSIGFDILENAMVNVDDGSIYYCAININEGFDFRNEGLVVTVSFKVRDNVSGVTFISHNFDEIFTFENEEEDLTAEDYKSREVISVNADSENNSLHYGIDVGNNNNTPDTLSSSDGSSDIQSEPIGKFGISVWIFAAAALMITVVSVVIFVRLTKKTDGYSKKNRK